MWRGSEIPSEVRCAQQHLPRGSMALGLATGEKSAWETVRKRGVELN